MANVITLKLVVDKKENRVLFADCDKEFVDVLFSFLTLPMGTIVRLLDKKSNIGCLDKLYESIENIDTKYFETEACKMMLLETRSEAEIRCEFLKINIGNQDPRRVYRCPKWDCYTKTRLLSDVRGARCSCGQAMDHRLVWNKQEFDPNADGVFLKGSSRFLVSDDLQVIPVSSVLSTLSLLERFGIQDTDSIETITVDVSKEKILILLKRMLLSRSPLSEVFLVAPDSISNDRKPEQCPPIPASWINEDCDTPKDSKVIFVKMVECKSMKKVVYVEGDKDLANVFFSFLTFPLGSIVKLLNKHSSLGCADNLYRSVEVLSGVGEVDHLKSTEYKEMLLSPMLVTHFGCSDQLLKIYEKPKISSKGELRTHVNPKLPIVATEQGGGFANGCIRFMVADDLIVSPCSFEAAIDAVKKLNVPVTSLVEREISLGEIEVLNLLEACITCPSVLSSVFSSKTLWKAK